MKKVNCSIENYNNLHNILICPLCSDNIKIDNNICLKCLNNHTFNISKKGTAILYKTSKLKKDKLYDKNLFINRRNFINSGFYDEIHNKICNIIKEYNNDIILDMGSGEGTHDYKIIQKLNNKSKMIGIDLSKDGIDLFNDYIDNNFLGIVADLNNMPFKDHSIDIILNILSPSNENEMSRLLKKDGIIIKVTPKKQYLHELRDVLNIKEYENEDIIFNNISNKYVILNKDEYVNTFNLTEKDFNYLVNMTPLLNNYNDIPKINEITIALNIYVIRNKNEKRL